jgi:hypothetical protein
MSTSLDGDQVKLTKDKIESTVDVYDTKVGKRSADWLDILSRVFIAICMTFGIMGLGLACKYFTLCNTPMTFGVARSLTRTYWSGEPQPEP